MSILECRILGCTAPIEDDDNEMFVFDTVGAAVDAAMGRGATSQRGKLQQAEDERKS